MTRLRFLSLGLASLFATATVAFAQTATPAAPADSAKKSPAPPAPLNPALPSLFVAGDSTAARGQGERQQGWGVPLAEYFDPAKINVVNRARGGRSSRTFINEGSWDKIVADLKAGDYVLIQFGTNDSSPVNEDPATPRTTWRFRGTLPGLGDETKEIDNLLTHQHEVVHTFGWYMRKMIADAKAKGATPVIVDQPVRNLWKNGRIERGLGRYSGWSYDLAKEAHVPFVDLTNNVADRLEAMGEEKTKAIYQQDVVHFNAVGADLHAQEIVACLKGFRPSPFTPFLSAKGEAVPADKYSWLRLPIITDAKLPTLFLAGDSTVRNGRGDGSNGEWGWGDYLGEHFDLTKINVVNRAVGGTGVQTFNAIGHWQRMLNLVRPGDVVMIQFGHNDNPPRGPAPGIGDETVERTDPKSKETHTLKSWGWYLRQDIADVRAKGATPIVCSLIPRQTWKDGKIARNKATFAGWAEQVAAQEKAPFVDLNEIIAARYDTLGTEKVAALFKEGPHTNLEGAKFNAECVVAGLKALPEDPLAAYLKN